MYYNNAIDVLMSVLCYLPWTICQQIHISLIIIKFAGFDPGERDAGVSKANHLIKDIWRGGVGGINTI